MLTAMPRQPRPRRRAKSPTSPREVLSAAVDEDEYTQVEDLAKKYNVTRSALAAALVHHALTHLDDIDLDAEFGVQEALIA